MQPNPSLAWAVMDLPNVVDVATWITGVGLVVVSCSWLWRRDGRRAVAEWCAANFVAMDDETFEFTMGRPAHVSVVGLQGGARYLFRFTLHSGLFNPPKSLLQVWGRVVLRERAQIE